MKTRPNLRIVLPGGSGTLGTILARRFQAAGDGVTVISRAQNRDAPWRMLPWDGVTLGPWAEAIDGADVVINLAGRSVNCRYTPANRRAITESRTLSTRIVGQAIARATRPPRVWLNASAATLYRDALDRPMDERTGEVGGDEPGAPETWRFSVGVVKSWESEFEDAMAPVTRKVAMRTSIVMDPHPGGAFSVLSGLVRKGLGGSQGSGAQYVSWMHDDDFARAVEFIVEREDIGGAVNFTAPNPVPNREFMRMLREAWGVNIGLPANALMLEVGALFLGAETELILKSRRVVPTRLLEAGFRFNFPTWPEAATDLVRRMRGGRSL